MPDQLTYAWIPFSAKGDDSQRIVEGYVSSPDIDLDQQIVDPDWLKGELPTWLARWGNIREQHRPDSAVGKAQSVDVAAKPGPHLVAQIVDDAAWKKVKAGVYNGFSIGVKQPKVVFDGAAKNGRIAGGKLIEVSIVDRPANDAARFTLVKRAGRHEWRIGEDGAVLQDSVKAAAVADVVKCDLQGCDCDCTPSYADPTCSCDCPLCTDARTAMAAATKAAETTAEQNDLPDDAFAYIAPGGSKDAEGKTTPRNKRHYPIHDDAHIRNALGRAAAQIKAGGEPAAIAQKALPAIRRAAKARGIGGDDKEKTVSAETQVVTPDAGKAAASHSEHRHPFKGVHNHEHDDQRGGTHTHAHMHDDDDMHDHPHLAGKDARLLSPEEREDARHLNGIYLGAQPEATKAMLAGHPHTGSHEHEHTHDGAAHSHDHRHSGDGNHAHNHSDGEVASLKAANDVNVINVAPGTPRAPSKIADGINAILRDAQTRIEQLASQVDRDDDGDADNAANMATGDKRISPQFAQDAGTPEVIRPQTLSLSFATEADLVKFIDARIAARGAAEFLTKAAAAEPLEAIPDIAKLAGGIAKGLEALAGQTKAVQDELAVTKAALAGAQADLDKIKSVATPVKGAVFAIDKGLGIDPDLINPDGSSKTAVPVKGSTQWLAAAMAKLTTEERNELAVRTYKEFQTNTR